MFRCVKAPCEPTYPTNLAELGFQFKNGQFVSDKGAHFAYYHTDNERANDLRKEAIHTCAREVVAAELTKHDIHELFLTGPDGTTVATHRPDSPHVAVLTTEASELCKKKDVVVIVGEGLAGQDGGIWTYRILMRQGGIEAGSAVGLAAKLAAHGKRSFTESAEPPVKDIAVDIAKLGLEERGQQKYDDTPGLLILNGGQLLYSHKEKKPMSVQTWQARPRRNALEPDYNIDEKYNRVPGHEDSVKHTTTIFKHIIPYLLRKNVRLYVVCIGDGAKDTLECLDQIFVNQVNIQLTRQLEAVALVQPYYDAANLMSESLKTLLAVRGKSWIQSFLPFGRLLQMPSAAKPTIDFEDIWSTSADSLHDANPIMAADKGTSAPEDSIGSINSKDTSEAKSDWGASESYADTEEEACEADAQQEVICPTFSAGDCDGITEMVFPKVMDEVLQFFWQVKADAEQLQACGEISLKASQLD